MLFLSQQLILNQYRPPFSLLILGIGEAEVAEWQTRYVQDVVPLVGV